MAKTVPELARETLKQLVARKLAPTPTSYQLVFNEAGRPGQRPAVPDRSVAPHLPEPAGPHTGPEPPSRALLDSAINQMNWQGVYDALLGYGDYTPRNPRNQARMRTSTAPRRNLAAPAPGVLRVGQRGGTCAHEQFLEQIARLIEFAPGTPARTTLRFSEADPRAAAGAASARRRPRPGETAAPARSGTGCRSRPGPGGDQSRRCSICCASSWRTSVANSASTTAGSRARSTR